MRVISMPPLPRGPQAHVHFVEPPGRRVHRQQVHDALREADEEHLVVDRLRAASVSALAGGVVQEHEVEVGGVAELDAAELAVADGADPDARGRVLAASSQRGTPNCAVDLPPGEPHGLLDDDLGDLREVIADPHQRNLAA